MGSSHRRGRRRAVFTAVAAAVAAAVSAAVCVLVALAALSLLPTALARAQEYTEPYYEYVGDTYAVGISLDPVFIDYLGVDLDRTGESHELLAYVGKPSTLWLGVGGWGTHQPTKPMKVELVQEDGRTVLTMHGIRFAGFLPTTMGQVAPVEADWEFTFYNDCFDMSLTWRMLQDVYGLQEAGWALNIDLPWYGDSQENRRISGDVQGFPRWIAWYGSKIGIAAAFRDGSSRCQANRWYGNLKSSYVIVHTWWKPGGHGVEWGEYPAGTWRVRFFRGAADIDAASRLDEELNH
ncbi:MAG: hypothetical protein VB144_08635 [Clostridia bacterium]|nr:hypothetical protein [Clostridia bacterium]